MKTSVALYYYYALGFFKSSTYAMYGGFSGIDVDSWFRSFTYSTSILERPIHVLWRGSVGKQFTPAIQDLLNNLHVEDDTRTQNTFEMGAVTSGYLNESRDPLSRI